MLNYKVDIVRPGVTARVPLMDINYVCMSTCKDAADISSEDNFANVLQSNVNVSHANLMKPNNLSQV